MSKTRTQDFDVIELTNDAAARSLGYDDRYRGLVVQDRGEWIADATDLADAAATIARTVGRSVVLESAADSYTGERRWTVVP